MAQTYDFIVVGAGASGAVLASRLAHTPTAPSILLVEAGSSNAEAVHLSGAERFNVAFALNSPLNWGYKTTPQTHAAGQRIDYSRGKGLGGSTAINFCGWTVGPRDDYDEWASMVGDERFGWQNVRRMLKRIENLKTAIPNRSMRKFVDARIETHSASGNLDLAYGEQWLPDVGDIFIAASQCGHRLNPDVNSGDPIGFGMASVCIADGVRATSASAYLSHPPPNLKILTNALVARLLFVGNRAAGVEIINGVKLHARKEVIISGGALNSPQILMLSGVGPAEELKKHKIPIIQHLPMVGQNLQDHCFSAAGTVLNEDPFLPPGPPSQSPTPMGWFKLPSVTTSPEFQALPTRIQQHMHKPTIPAMEIATHSPNAFLEYTPAPDTTYFGAICLLLNPQSRGSVTLRSASPSDAPIIDPKFLSHPFDRRVLVEGMRETIRILSAPIYFSRTIRLLGPKDNSDEAILEYVRSNLRSSWHMSSTTCMGLNPQKAVVDHRFRVFGLEGCRVVDLGVCPFIINAHTQSTAYVLGEIAAEVLAEEYGLGEVRVSGRPRRSGD
ncbi:alcohol oxidase [Lindgomyces ingoldianus]|uniref:Alcohol oxidase n=1 Tax=Lindgomyces ingoldianus TaxID=673940 RepID=A0ACB6R7E6_9PLEO|nr:alcohol oxidase [Lindgomyces ingoldianus]KAF2475007.1 alcohol oxidase [Lindgomyces ingoldianus]